MKIKHLLMLVLALFLSVPMTAAEQKQDKKPQTKQEQVIQKFIGWDKKLNTLDTVYVQETSFEGTLISKSLGHLYKVGTNLRLDTLEDGKITQYAKTDKKIINIFDDKDNLIMQMDWESWRDNQQNKSLFDFNNYENILKKHDVKNFEITDDNYILTLTPKDTEDGYILTFLLDKKNCFPKEINLTNEGVLSKTVLQDIKINTAIPKEIFNEKRNDTSK